MSALRNSHFRLDDMLIQLSRFSQSLIALNHPEYVPQRWHGTLLIIAVLALSVLFNVFLAQRLHLVEGAVLVLHVCGFFAIMIPLWVLSPTAKSHDVWTTFSNPGWESQGLSCLIGIVASVAPLLGADAAGKLWPMHCLRFCKD